MPDTITKWGIQDCLTGLKVVDLSRNLPGPFATRLLADMGAQIIKIEPKQGDPARALGSLFDALNHDKTCEKVDFKTSDGIDTIKSYLKTADVMIDSFRPDVLVQMGLDPKELLAQNPKLVIVSITGYGVNNPWEQKAGHDINFVAMSGVLDQLKTAEGGQAMPNVQFADLAGGSDTAVIALLGAVISAQRTGKGRHIVVSMAHSMYQHMVMPKATGQMLSAVAGGKAVKPQYDFLGGLLPCYRLYATQDRRYMAVGSLELKFWQGVCERLGVPELANVHWQTGAMPNTDASKNATKQVAEIFASQPLAHWTQVFADSDVCVTPVLSLAEAKAHPLFEQQDQYGNIAGWQTIS